MSELKSRVKDCLYKISMDIMIAEQKIDKLKDLLLTLYDKETKLKYEWYYIEIGDDIQSSKHFQTYVEKKLKNFVTV